LLSAGTGFCEASGVDVGPLLLALAVADGVGCALGALADPPQETQTPATATTAATMR
jgi:hypothetical protein